MVVGRQILGKPEGQAGAKDMLKLLSGTTHRVISAICLYDTEKHQAFCRSEVSEVTFRKLSHREIDRYCESSDVLDKAGSYAIQEVNDQFVARLKGSYYNVVGLPVNSLLRLLKKYVIV